MERLITSFDGSTHQIECIGCTDKDALQIEGLQAIFNNHNFGVYQDFETPIPGFYVIETKRHVRRILDFNSEEQSEFPVLLFHLRQVMESALDLHQVTLIQEERSGHFHTWLFPHYPWMNEIQPPRIENIRTLIDYAIEYRNASQYAQNNMRTPEVYQQIIDANKKVRQQLIISQSISHPNT